MWLVGYEVNEEADPLSYLPENLQNDPTVKSIVASPEYQGASNLERFNILETGINAYNQALYESTWQRKSSN